MHNRSGEAASRGGAASFDDLEWMNKAYRLTRKDGAPGIVCDGDGLRGKSGGATFKTSRPPDAHQRGTLYRAARATALHPQGGRDETAAGHSDAGRQVAQPAISPAAGAGLRGRLGRAGVWRRTAFRGSGPLQ